MNASKRKGTAFESLVVDYLRQAGFPAVERRALSGNLDRGDIAGVPGVMIECKAEKQITLATYMGEVDVEKANAGARIGVAVVKRRNKGIDKAYVVMDLAQFAQMIQPMHDHETEKP